MFFIALYVGIITEALLPTFNVAKAQIAKGLASKNCYIKNIESLETLGTTTIICTNKTGVITQSKMIVAQMWIDNQLMASYMFMRDYKSKYAVHHFAATSLMRHIYVRRHRTQGTIPFVCASLFIVCLCPILRR